MKSDCKVLDLFDTSLGTIAVLGFVNKTNPSINMSLTDKSNSKWIISAIGKNRKLDSSNKYSSYEFESIWDCVLTPLNHIQLIRIDDCFEIIDNDV